MGKWLIGQNAKVDPRLRDVIARYPMRVNTYYLGLIQKIIDGIWKQTIPDPEELEHFMCLSEDPLDEILGKLKQIDNLEIIRIGTRVPYVWPQKIIEDTELMDVLNEAFAANIKIAPIHINTHFNHPNEITD